MPVRNRTRKEKEVVRSVQTSSSSPVTWCWVGCSPSTLLTPIVPKSENKWVVVYVCGGARWHTDIMGTFSSLSWGVSIRRFSNTRQLEAVLYGLRVAFSAGHGGSEKLVLKSQVFCRPCSWAQNQPLISPLLVSIVSFMCTAEVWFPQVTQSLQWQRIIFAMVFQECFRLEVTTIYGFRSHRQLTFSI